MPTYEMEFCRTNQQSKREDQENNHREATARETEDEHERGMVRHDRKCRLLLSTQSYGGDAGSEGVVVGAVLEVGEWGGGRWDGLRGVKTWNEDAAYQKQKR
jgi:hypothetical protein